METFKKYLPLIVLAVVGYLLIRKVASSSSGNITTNLTTVTPNTAAANQPLTDPLLPFRAEAFNKLTDAAIAQTQAETAKGAQAIQREAILSQAQTQQMSLANQLQQYLAGLQNQAAIAFKGFDTQAAVAGIQSGTQEKLAGIQGNTQLAQVGAQTELAKYLASAQQANQQFLQDSYLRQLELYYQQRDNDRQAQQAAIDRTNSTARTSSIIGSIGTALGGLFGGLFGGGSTTGGSVPSYPGGIYGTPPTFPNTTRFGDPFNVSGNLLGGGSSLFNNGFGSGFGF